MISQAIHVSYDGLDGYSSQSYACNRSLPCPPRLRDSDQLAWMSVADLGLCAGTWYHFGLPLMRGLARVSNAFAFVWDSGEKG